jgi:gentisate 1,2-dioxygenase
MSEEPRAVSPHASPERESFGRRLEAKHAAPLWNVLDQIVPREPRPACIPALWRYKEMRPLLTEAGRLITAAEAERRVLLLENPGLPGASRISQSLYAGLQLIMPGEFAPSHRHKASALRLVLEGHGAYTTVNSERIAMAIGDLILTPSWSVHDHGNPGGEPVIWMDGLDIPIVNMFDASFAEREPLAEKATPDARFPPPPLSYPFEQSREALERLSTEQPLHPCHGTRLVFTNPVTGGPVLPTLGAFLELLPAGFRGAPFRSTDSTVYCAVEGSGVSRVAGTSLEWRARDIFVVPSWQRVAHEADETSVLFGFSDRPIQEALGLWREEQGGEA